MPLQTATSAENWLAICQLSKLIGSEPPIRTWRAFGWHASRPDWDLGIPIGSGNTELEAIADLLEQEDD